MTGTQGGGLLTGVYFHRERASESIPNLSTHSSSRPLPSRRILPLSQRVGDPFIATLSNPASTVVVTLLHILRAILLVILPNLAGSVRSIKKISVANTSVTYQDGPPLATSESGPPMRFTLPALRTDGWFNGEPCREILTNPN